MQPPKVIRILIEKRNAHLTKLKVNLQISPKPFMKRILFLFLFTVSMMAYESQSQPGTPCFDCNFNLGIEDCNGNCIRSDWWGDGFCDSSGFTSCGALANFDCSELQCDLGDCPPGCPPASGVVPGPCTTPGCANPVPDDCANVCHLDTLSSPQNCPSEIPVYDSFCLTNVGASAEVPYTSLVGCVPHGDMPNPALDVWYSFVASSKIIDVIITGNLNNPSLGFYEGTNCANLLGRGCANGSDSTLNATFISLTPGSTYYLQISGGNDTATGDFELIISSYNDCDPCLIQSNLTANPLPVNGKYPVGQTVDFCYTVTEWNQTSINWIHAVTLDFGAAWDLSTLTVAPPSSCDGQGAWGWYDTITSSATGLTIGPGFAYETPLGSPGGSMDGNPGNNFGDNCTGSVNWQYCWSITANNCPPNNDGESLNIDIFTYGDGESGSWTSFACSNDPNFAFFASVNCCNPPLNPATTITGSNSVKLTWQPDLYATGYRLKGKPVNWNTWATVDINNPAISTFDASGLNPNLEYEWKIRSNCPGGEHSAFSPMQYFRINDPACDAPDSSWTKNLTPTSVRLKWTAVPGAVRYELQGRVVGTIPVATFTVPGFQSGFSAFGLAPGTAYEWNVRAICSHDGSLVSPWSDINIFATPISKTQHLPSPENGQEVRFTIQPNPSTGLFSLVIENVIEFPILLSVTDALGKKVFSDKPLEKNQTLIDLTSQAGGIYFIKINSGNKALIQKVFKK